MQDLMENKDLRIEHKMHTDKWYENCSMCFKEKNTCISCGGWSDGYSSCDKCMKKAEETDIGI